MYIPFSEEISDTVKREGVKGQRLSFLEGEGVKREGVKGQRLSFLEGEGQRLSFLTGAP